MAATLQDYLASLQGKRVAVIGIGVSNTPLIETLLQGGFLLPPVIRVPGRTLGIWRTGWKRWELPCSWGNTTWMAWTRM